MNLDYSTLPTLEKRIAQVKDIPIQIVILGEATYWCNFVAKIIEQKKQDDLKYAM